MKTKTNLLITLMILAVSFTACKKENTEEKEEQNDDKTVEIVLSRETDYGDSDWIYFNFETQQEVNGVTPSNYQNNLDWDIAFNRYNVRTNGGTSGIGASAALDLGVVDFNSVTEAPDTGYIEDTSIEIVEDASSYPPTMITVTGNTVFIDAITFSGPPPAYTPNNHIFIVKTADGKYVKLWITGFYNATGESGFVNFKYQYQDNGSRFFD